MTQIDLERGGSGGGGGGISHGQGDVVSRRANLSLNLTSDQTSSSNDENTGVKRRSQPLVADHHRGYDSGWSLFSLLTSYFLKENVQE